jgi:hypothetical protein
LGSATKALSRSFEVRLLIQGERSRSLSDYDIEKFVHNTTHKCGIAISQARGMDETNGPSPSAPLPDYHSGRLRDQWCVKHFRHNRIAAIVERNPSAECRHRILSGAASGSIALLALDQITDSRPFCISFESALMARVSRVS